MNKFSFQYCQKVVILNKDKNSVLLCKRQSEEDYDGMFSFPGGKMEVADLSILASIRRELDEELGEDFKISIFPTFSTNVLFIKGNGSSMVLPHYLAIHKSGEIKLNEAEYSHFQWVTFGDLSEFEPKIPNIPDVLNTLLKLQDVNELECIDI